MAPASPERSLRPSAPSGAFSAVEEGSIGTFGLPWALKVSGESGAEVLHVRGNGSDRFFGISFVTPPADSRGIPHVLEHCVLNSSRKYPVRDAFNELWRGSLHSYLNAATGPDRTVYYAGSPSADDFRNILDVYLDLVFNPVLDPRRVALESFHYRPLRSMGRLYAAPAGVIYSEMKGSYSDPDEVSSLTIQAAILPDTPYRFDPGGHPSEMHKLSYEEIVQYHRRFYQPSNCRMFVCAPEPWEEIEPALGPFLGGSAGTGERFVPQLQTRWKRPRKSRTSIAGGDRDDGAALNLSWLLGEVSDSRGMALCQLLDDVLLSDAGPLCRLLLDSRTGTDLSTETGIDVEMREAVMTAGLRGCDERDAEKVRKLVLGGIEGFAGSVPDPDLVDASLNSLLLQYGERVDELPMRLFLRALRGWTYGVSPAGWLDHAGSIRELGADPDLGVKLAAAARALLLENRHRLDSVTVPGARAGRSRLTRLRTDSFEKLSASHGELEEYAAAGDAPGTLRSIPRLDPAVLGDEPNLPALETREVDGIPLHFLPADTSGLVYLEAAFDLSRFGRSEQILLPLLGRCLSGMPAPGMTWDKVALKLARLSGGLEFDLGCGTVGGKARPWLLVSAAAFEDRFHALLDLLRVLLNRDLDDPERFERVVSEIYGDTRSDLVPSCDSFARLAAGAGVRPSSMLHELWEGMSQMELLERLYDDGEAAFEARGRMSALARRVLGREGAVFAVSGSGEACSKAGTAVAALASSLPSPSRDPEAAFEPSPAKRTLIRWNTSVASACLCGPAPLLGEADAAVFTVGTAVLSDGVLYNALRTAAGSYEVSAWHDRVSGLLSICSYRDPDTARTLEAFRGADRILRRSPPSAEDVKLGILATFAPMEKPASARGNLRFALFRMMSGISRETSRSFRAALKAVTREDVMERFVPLLSGSLESAGMGVVAPRSASPSAIFGDPEDVVLLPRRGRRWRSK
jgi:Zn-dependent M16 (insulinase) family peptidase